MGEPQTQEWQETSVTTAALEPKTFPGKRLGDTGLGYWIMSEDEYGPALYVPTHLPSGYGCGGGFFSEKLCQQYIEQLASRMNFNQPYEQLTADPAYRPDQFADLYTMFSVEDAAETAGGGAW